MWPSHRGRVWLVRQVCGLLLLLSLAPLFLGASRKLATFGRADLLFSVEENGYRVRKVGDSATSTRLRPGDLVLLVDGRPALSEARPGRRLAEAPVDLTILREQRLVTLRAGPVPAPWDFRYLVLLVVGLASLAAAAAAGWSAARSTVPAANLLFTGFGTGLALVLVLTIAPPVDGLFRWLTLLEELARALFPAFLLAFLFLFPRRARGVRPWAFFLPSLVLCGEAVRVYAFPSPDRDAALAVASLDAAGAAWIGAAILVAVARVVHLSRQKIDLLTEKQIRFLLLGTAIGLLPVALLGFLPFLLGRPIPVLTTISVLPLAVVPAAFLAALVRFRLWDVEVLGREATATLGAGLLGAALFALAHAFAQRPAVAGLPYASALVETGAGLLIAVSVLPARRSLSTALSRLQYGERSGERERLLAVARELLLPRRMPEIGALLAERVTVGLGLTPAALLPVDGGSVDATAVDGGPPLSLAELPAEVRKRAARLSRHVLAEVPTPAVARLRRAGFRTIAPLAVSGRLLALFAVGDRDGRIPPSAEDLELLESVLAPAALALDHARLYAELEREAERYRRLKEFHEDVVEGSAAAIAATDDSGRLTSVNPALCRLLDRPEEELVGRSAAEVLPAELLSAGRSARVTAALPKGERVLDVAVSPFPGAGGASAARVLVVHDATEIVRLEKALADRERLSALSALSAGVAHEVNTPLTGVASFARLLLDETPAEDPRRPTLEKIEQHAFRASRLIGSLLDLARGRPRDLSPLEPADLAREAVRSLADEAASRGVALTLAAPAALPRVAGHADALVQVLVNLVKNGIEAAGAEHGRRGAVAVEVRASGADVLIDVGDDGPGMTEEQRRRVFEPFYSTKSEKGGVGLGLAIASDIIRSHGGTLSVASAPGRGSRFTVSLPALA